MFGYLVIACFLGVAASAPSYGGAIVDTVSIPKYAFNYAVSDPHTGDNKAQSEVRDGGVVRGSYSLAEPDGTIRVVDYAADPLTGFNAKVKRIGTAVHPQTVHVAPVYNKPIITPISSAYLAPNIGYVGYNNLDLGNLGYNSWNLGAQSLGGWGHNSWALNNGWGHNFI